jgi:hypothetical protein
LEGEVVLIGDITKLDTPLEYFFDGNIAQSPSKVAKDHAPPNTSYLVWGGLFPPPTRTKNVIVHLIMLSLKTLDLTIYFN